jgi:hypothetical protein
MIAGEPPDVGASNPLVGHQPFGSERVQRFVGLGRRGSNDSRQLSPRKATFRTHGEDPKGVQAKWISEDRGQWAVEPHVRFLEHMID